MKLERKTSVLNEIVAQCSPNIRFAARLAAEVVNFPISKAGDPGFRWKPHIALFSNPGYKSEPVIAPVGCRAVESG